MRARFLARVALLVVACVAAPVAVAGPTYEWEGACAFREVTVGLITTSLPCPDVVHGFLQMPDGYVPGTPFDFAFGPLAGLGFTFFDDALPNSGQRQIAPEFSFIGLLPLEQGAGTLSIADDAGFMQITPTSWLFYSELTRGVSAMFAGGGTSTFRLITEPGMLPLFFAALLGLLTTVTRPSKQV